MQDNAQDVQLIYRQFPLMQLGQDGQPFHNKAELAAKAAEAAGAQGKFWEMHDLLYSTQGDWGGLDPAAFRLKLTEYATQAGLDLPRFEADLGSQPVAERVKAAFDNAQTLKLGGTPTILVNDQPYQLPTTPEMLSFAVRLVKEGTFGKAPPLTVDPASAYTATVETTQGDIVFALDAAKAPQAVNSFAFLARHGWYDNTPFMVVTTTFLIAGDPGQTSGYPGYTVPPENNQVSQADPGLIGLFPLDQNGQYFGAMFFVARDVLSGTLGLPFFGKVVGGQDVLAKLQPRISPQAPVADIIKTVKVDGPTIAPWSTPTPVPTSTPPPTPTLRPGMQWTTPPAMAIDVNKSYTATIRTAKGDIVIQLLPKFAPQTVNNFVFLARQGFYDGVTFHRVLDGFMAQTGDPTGTGMGGPGYAFNDEITSTLKFDGPGVVAMANAGPNTNGSQFFITYAAQPHLDGGYSIFGKVVQGQDVADALTRRDPQKDPNAPPGDAIITITIEEK